MAGIEEAGGKTTTKISCGTTVLRRADVILPPRGSVTCHAQYVGKDPIKIKAAGPCGCRAKDDFGADFVLKYGDFVTPCGRPVTEITEWEKPYPKRLCPDRVCVHYCFEVRQNGGDDAKCTCGVCGEYKWRLPPACECDKTEEYCRNDKCAVM